MKNRSTKIIRRRTPQRAAAVLAAALLFLLAGCGGKVVTETKPIPVGANEERLAYLTELGWQVAEEPLATLVLQLPAEFSADYSDYIKLQEEQGLPFSQCAGKTVSRYTYAVNNYPDYTGPVQINLYVCDGALVGGDVVAPGENGFVRGLAFPK